MDTTEIDGNRKVRSRAAVIRLDIEDQPSTMKLERMAPLVDDFLSCLSPLLYNMRAFGFYFTREPHKTTGTTEFRVSTGCQNYWNPGRIYSTIMFVVTLISSLRFCTIIDGKETLGVVLFFKLGVISSAFLTAILHTAYYVASHTGKLDRVLRQVDFPVEDYSPKYSRKAKVVTVICWAYLVVNIIFYIIQCFVRGYDSDPSMTLLINTLRLSEVGIYIVKSVYTLLQTYIVATWGFTQAMKYIKRNRSIFHNIYFYLNP